MFADGSNLFTSRQDLTQMSNSINQEIPRLIDWLRANRLSLNIAKTNFMIFGPKRANRTDNINISIEGKKI
jgi:hypothetical protein